MTYRWQRLQQSHARWLSGLNWLAAPSLVAIALAGCGGTISFGSSSNSPTPFPAREGASPLPNDADTMTALLDRPMRPPTLDRNSPCPISSTADLGKISPNFGSGVGPVYLSGPISWYSGGQLAILMVDSKYSGPLLVRGFQLSGEGVSTVKLSEPATPFDPTAKERQHGVAVVSAVLTAGGGAFLETVVQSVLWRAWYGWLATDSPGCFGLQMDGDVFTEFIVFAVLAGNPAPPS